MIASVLPLFGNGFPRYPDGPNKKAVGFVSAPTASYTLAGNKKRPWGSQSATAFRFFVWLVHSNPVTGALR